MQLTTNGHRVYLTAVELAFGTDVDYAMLVELYEKDAPDQKSRYNLPGVISCRAIPLIGKQRTEHQNLTIRMRMRRFTRLTNAFSKN